MTSPTFALALPHTPWIPERVTSFERLESLVDPLGTVAADAGITHFERFTERLSNRVWSQKLWRWARDTNATHLIQLQDDVIVAPNFWPALRAMVEAVPDRIIGLHANHPLAVVQHRAGRRWYRDFWLTGPAYVFPRWHLDMFLKWCDEHPDRVADTNEDSLVSYWAQETGVAIWHPVPTITDHDLGIPSTYGNDGHHEWSMYRHAAVTWRDAPSVEAMADPNYWRCTEDSAPLLPGPGTQLCWFCGEEEGKIASQQTGARIGRICLSRAVNAVIVGAG